MNVISIKRRIEKAMKAAMPRKVTCITLLLPPGCR